MEIQNKKIEDIHPYGKNAKKHPSKQVIQVANSIKEFGFNQPIVVDKNNIIIVGHGRLLAAQFLGLKELSLPTLDLTGFDREIILEKQKIILNNDKTCDRCLHLRKDINGHIKKTGHSI